MNRDAVNDCTPSKAEVIAKKISEDVLKGAITGVTVGVAIGSETGPGALMTGSIGGVVGIVAGGFTGIVDGMIAPLTPDGACLAKQLLSENVTPLDTPGNLQRPAATKRTV